MSNVYVWVYIPVCLYTTFGVAMADIGLSQFHYLEHAMHAAQSLGSMHRSDL